MANPKEDFDPYYKWLGIRPKDQPPHHYRLLGIEIFESDIDVIANAADMQMAHLRKFQSGKHSQESQKLLNKVASAKICLLNAEKKAEYDEELEEKSRPPKVEPLPPAEPTPVEPEPMTGFPFVNTGQVEQVDEVPFFGAPQDVGPPPEAESFSIGPPPGFVEPVEINPFAEAETEEPPEPEPTVTPRSAGPTAKPPIRKPSAPPAEKPSLDEALSKVMGAAAPTPPPAEESFDEPSSEVTDAEDQTPLTDSVLEPEAPPLEEPSPTEPVPEPTTPETSLAPDVKPEQPPLIDRPAPSWVTGWGEVIGFAVFACLIVTVLVVAAYLEPETDGIEKVIRNNKWTFFSCWFLAVLGAIAAILSGAWHFGWLKSSSKGDPEMREIAGQVRSGTLAFLWQYVKFGGIYFWAFLSFLGLLAYVLKVKQTWMFGDNMQSRWMFLGLLMGVLSSGLAQWFGMRAAIWGSTCVTGEGKESLGHEMQTTFKFGAVAGLLTAGFCLLEITLWFGFLYWLTKEDALLRADTLHRIMAIIFCFGVGAASHALFTGIGGRIFARASDMGSEFASKGGGIPKNHRRNPGAIAQSVGNVIGLGADLYLVYFAAIVTTVILGVVVFRSHTLLPEYMATGLDHNERLTFGPEVITGMQLRACLLPLLVAAAGILASIVGIYGVGAPEKGKPKNLLREFDRGVNWSVCLMIPAALLFTRLLFPDFMGLSLSIIVGVLAGWVIGRWGERVAGTRSRLAYGVAQRAEVGPAALTHGGVANAMRAVPFPIIMIAVAALLAYGAATHWNFDPRYRLTLGFYGIGLAAVGMLATFAMTMAGDTCASIADNTLRHSMMATSKPRLREKAAVLNAVGGTLAMRGKVFAIAATALVGLLFVIVYVTTYGCYQPVTHEARGLDSSILTIMYPTTLVGILVGMMMPFVFCAIVFHATERLAHTIARAIREQYEENSEMLQQDEAPDPCPFIGQRTNTLLYRIMLWPLAVVMLVPLAVGIVLGATGIVGFLFGATISGLCVALFLACTGQSWALAKEHVQKTAEEEDLPGDPASEVAVGNPAREVASRSLPAFLLLMIMFTVLLSGLIIRYNVPGVANQLFAWIKTLISPEPPA